MRLILIFMEVLLIMVDILIFIKYRKVLMKHSKNGKLRVPVGKILPYLVSMVAVSLFVPVFAFIAFMV